MEKFVKQIILVQKQKNNKVFLEFYQQNINKMWKKILKSDAYIGKNGFGKEKEGDLKTPIGTFNVTQAFGIKQNPGTFLPYINVTNDLYSCSDEIYYNQIINVKDTGHINCSGEHLIDFVPEYNYAICFDYNKENIFGKGSSIFLHCKGKKDYTAGCIAIEEKYMKCLLKKSKPGVRIIIKD